MSAPSATAAVTVAAPPGTVYGLITDLEVLAELADETTAMRWVSGSSATPGARFRGNNRNGWRRWSTTCTVTDAASGQTFAFDVSHLGIPIARWQYDLEAVADGCRVTESTWDRRPGWFRLPAELATGVRDRAEANTTHITATLGRLKIRAESGAAD
ncbi:MAG TPA: SRPBCC family protein [Jatrophihabitans sp.]